MGFEVIDCSRQDPVEAVKKLTDGEGADAVIVAVGATSANQQGLSMLKEKMEEFSCLPRVIRRRRSRLTPIPCITAEWKFWELSEQITEILKKQPGRLVQALSTFPN